MNIASSWPQRSPSLEVPKLQLIWRTTLVFLLSLLASVALAAGRVLEGRVTRVIDGDTIEVLVEKDPVRVRIAGIDTPERGQPWASRSKQALSERVFGKEVRVIEVTVDVYGRTIGEVYADNVCVGCGLVRDGNAWVYRRFTDDAVLFQLEDEAREARRGLWGLPETERVPPWEWRRLGKKAHDDRELRAQEAGPFECGVKQSCREMISCEEARFHLVECDLDGLDGDGDGVPCESICR
jgi:endonuclease YncB( thermonuclease family)